MSNKKWFPSSWLLAQETHLLLGILSPFVGIYYGLGFVVGALAMLLFSLFKETVIDPKVEGNPFFWDGATDWLFYWIGTGIAAGLYFLPQLVHLL